MTINLAAANATISEQQSAEDQLPFNYVPTGWVGITFLTLFSLTTGEYLPYEVDNGLIPTTAGHLIQALLLRTRYMIPTLVLCGFGEILGWAGRYWGHVNPHNGDAFLMQ